VSHCNNTAITTAARLTPTAHAESRCAEAEPPLSDSVGAGAVVVELELNIVSSEVTSPPPPGVIIGLKPVVLVLVVVIDPDSDSDVFPDSVTAGPVSVPIVVGGGGGGGGGGPVIITVPDNVSVGRPVSRVGEGVPSGKSVPMVNILVPVGMFPSPDPVVSPSLPVGAKVGSSRSVIVVVVRTSSEAWTWQARDRRHSRSTARNDE
jgi:hypothetical protein